MAAVLGSSRFGIWRRSKTNRGTIYYQRGSGKALSVEDVATINTLVAERSIAKSTMDYDRAFEIFDQLTNEYTVNIDDKSGDCTKEYQLNVNDSSFVPDEKVQAMIGKKLGERILARKARNFDLAGGTVVNGIDFTYCSGRRFSNWILGFGHEGEYFIASWLCCTSATHKTNDHDIERSSSNNKKQQSTTTARVKWRRQRW